MNESDYNGVTFGYQWNEAKDAYIVYKVKGESRTDLATITGYQNVGLAESTLSFYIGREVSTTTKGSQDSPHSATAKIRKGKS